MDTRCTVCSDGVIAPVRSYNKPTNLAAAETGTKGEGCIRCDACSLQVVMTVISKYGDPLQNLTTL